MTRPEARPPMPATRTSRSGWPRPSLGMILLLIAAASVPLAMVVNRARRQAEAVRAIREAGGQVIYDWQVPTLGVTLSSRVPRVPGPPAPPGPAWLRRAIGDDVFQSVDSVHFGGPGVSDARVARCLSSLPGLRYMTFLSCSIEPGWFAALPELPRLEKVVLIGANFTAADLGHLGRMPNLRSLDLSYAKIGDEAVPHLLALLKLKSLNVSGCGLTDDGLGRLARGRWPNLARLVIIQVEVTAETVAEFRRMHPGVEVVDSPNLL